MTSVLSGSAGSRLATPLLVMLIGCLSLGVISCDNGVEVRSVQSDIADDDTDPNGSDGGGGDDNSGGDNQGEGEPGALTRGVIENPYSDVVPIQQSRVVSAIAADQRSRVFTGSIDNQEGVFYLDSKDRLIGLTIAGASAQSIRANASAADSQNLRSFQQFTHPVRTENNGVTVSPFADLITRTDATIVEIINGVSITSMGDGVAINLQADAAALLPIDVDSLEGVWTSAYRLCDSLGENCSQVATRFSAANSVLQGWSSVFTSDEVDLLPSDLSGSLSQAGPVVLVELRWNTYSYEGIFYAIASDPTHLFFVATTDSETADERMLVGSFVMLVDN